MKTLIIATLLTAWSLSHAQVFPVQVNPELSPPYSPYLGDYTAPGAQSFAMHVVVNDMTVQAYRCKLRLTIEGIGITLRTKESFQARPIVLQGGGIPQIFYGEDIAEYFHPDALDFSGLSRSAYARTVRLPEGIYRFSIEVLDYNRGTVVSNKGSATAWIILNDPPILNLPANNSTIEIQDPSNIPFTWSPRHAGSPNSAFTTEYTFRLIELWPENRNPFDAFNTQQPLFETTTRGNQIVYGIAEPLLIPGRKYAWQVQARDAEGKDLFKHNGRSEAYVFRYGQALGTPENLRMRWAKPATLAIQWDPIGRRHSNVRYRLKYRPRRRSEDHVWYETWTRFTEKTLYDLQINTAYEMQIRAENDVQESPYSDIEVFTTLREGVETFVCKDDLIPPPPPANSLPVFPLMINDTIHAGGYDVLVRDVMKVESRYYGSGLAIVPWFNNAKVKVTFEKISVNDQFWLKEGTIKSVWHAQSTALWKEQVPMAAGTAPQTGELDISVVAADSIVKIQNAAIASVTKDDAGDIVITTTDGKQQVIPKGESYAVVDEVGNGYVIDEKGNIAKTTAAEATAAAHRGTRSYDLTVAFTRGNGRFGFDEKKYEGLSQYYQQLEDGTYVPWKALSSSGTDVIHAKLAADKHQWDHITFSAGSSSVTTSPSPAGDLTLTLQGKASGLEEELLALFSPSDTVPPQVLGKVNLVTYNPLRYDLEIVTINDADIPGALDAAAIARALNGIYSQAVVEWTVAPIKDLKVPLDDQFDEGETGIFSNYTDDMKKVLRAHGPLRNNTYYLFIVQEPRNPSALGYMPRNRQAGFVFSGPHHGDEREFLKTIAHELGHGAFNLEHTFGEHSLPAGITDNVMDYSDGTALYKYQWDYIHDPRPVMGLFEGGEESELNYPLMETEMLFLQKFGDQYKGSACWSVAVSKAYEARRRFGLDVALYAGFLRLLLCETEKATCEKNSNINPYACGLINGLLQELDWITMLESVEGLSVDPEEILMCTLNSIPIGALPDNKLTLERILFKCLVGIELGELNDIIKEFVIENWDEPYYQGQATAYTLTLLSPFKQKILTNLEKIPEHARNISHFNFFSKAGSREELLDLALVRSKLVDDEELELLGRQTRYLSAPQLPKKVAATFTNSVYTNRQLSTPERFFKYHGINNQTGRFYTWVVKNKYSSEKALREGVAINRKWNVDITLVSEFEAPVGTWVSEGTAASLGVDYPGGDYQAVIFLIQKSWITKTTKAF